MHFRKLDYRMVDFFRDMPDFHVHILQMTVHDEFQVTRRRLNTTWLGLKETLHLTTDAATRADLTSQKHALLCASRDLVQAYAALREVAGLEVRSEVRRVNSNLTFRHRGTDGFLNRLLVYDGLSMVYQQYVRRKLEKIDSALDEVHQHFPELHIAGL